MSYDHDVIYSLNTEMARGYTSLRRGYEMLDPDREEYEFDARNTYYQPQRDIHAGEDEDKIIQEIEGHDP